MKTIDCQFQSEGTTCVGTLMLPDDGDRPPIIVMAHGFANIRTARLPAYAERFAEAGYAAFFFDYRTFGDSDGEPRHWVHPGRQLRDWEAAIDYLRTLPAIDAGRMILWGTSYSGGYVLQLAARSENYKAVISQIPHVSGPATAAMVHPVTSIKGALAGLYDLALSMFNRTHYSPIAGKPGELAAIVGDDPIEGYRTMIPPEARWENRVLSRSFLQVPFFSPRNEVRRINSPVLMIAARRDSVVSPSAARRAARRIPDCTFYLLDCDHFSAYFGEHFERTVDLEIAFLRERVPIIADM